jgi:RNA polymerase sigma-70 factor (ECF subfamily)
MPAVAELYQDMSRGVLVFFTRRVCDGEIALDLTAETFARAVAGRRRFRGASRGEAMAWIWGIARNVLGEFLDRGRVERRALKRLGLRPPLATDEEITRIEDLAGVAHVRAAVADALGDLRNSHREALRLRVVEELDYPEVARRLGVTEPTARARVSRGLRLLASALEDLNTGTAFT